MDQPEYDRIIRLAGDWEARAAELEGDGGVFADYARLYRRHAAELRDLLARLTQG